MLLYVAAGRYVAAGSSTIPYSTVRGTCTQLAPKSSLLQEEAGTYGTLVHGAIVTTVVPIRQ